MEELDDKPRRSIVYSVVVSILVIGGLIFVAYMYTRSESDKVNQRTDRVVQESNRRFEQLIRESNQKWCGIIGTFDAAYRAQPPTTDTGRLVASQMHQLSLDYGCK